MRVNAIVVAAGKGERMGTLLPKPFLPLCGLPLFIWTLRHLEQSSQIHRVIIVIAPEREGLCQELLATHGAFRFSITLTHGGQERQDSVRLGLTALEPDCDVVVIHDAARPFVTKSIIDQSIEVAATHGAALVAVPAKDTIKRANESDFVMETVARKSLWLAQTPQTFQVALIRNAYAHAVDTGIRGTDDAALVEALGGTIKIVIGTPLNVKITTPEDMQLAEILVRGGISRQGK
jgi:2-C-methyl-D-erythritol 4-phosphate cytidylyltransferase